MMIPMTSKVVTQRIVRSLTTFPIGWKGWRDVVEITSITTVTAGIVAYVTGFIDCREDFDPPTLPPMVMMQQRQEQQESSSASSSSSSSFLPLVFVSYIRYWVVQPIVRACFFPAFLEELIWRSSLIPIHLLLLQQPSPLPSPLPLPSQQIIGFLKYYKVPIVVVLFHVASHPLVGATIWPRGSIIFQDVRFLILATIVLSGSTVSYIISGGSVWAAMITHAIPVALWRDFFGGEQRLSTSSSSSSSSSSNSSSSSSTKNGNSTTK